MIRIAGRENGDGWPGRPLALENDGERCKFGCGEVESRRPGESRCASLAARRALSSMFTARPNGRPVNKQRPSTATPPVDEATPHNPRPQRIRGRNPNRQSCPPKRQNSNSQTVVQTRLVQDDEGVVEFGKRVVVVRSGMASMGQKAGKKGRRV
ncbi:hypothetical protein Dda_2618 [Drechslerella dactyloides]|uniref:Uncharacterized protein n=1 Tax=Drechslerella dactyloides TaxID=74499 RepID=A0AAD6NKG3_DREDA|nr:hypothetical protein Dda_2618 [Drechslerella dactyloides]